MLRDYQQDLYDKTAQALRGGYRRILVVAPCGAGKSYLFAQMARNTQGEVLVLVHRNELKHQHQELMKSLGIENVRVQTYQTENKYLCTHKKPKLLIVDEAHLSRSNSWAKIIQHYDTYTVGLTATPIRLDNRPLGDIYEVLIQGVDTKWLIQNQRLAPYEYYAPLTVDTSEVRTLAGDFVQSDLEKLMTERAIYGDVIGSYRKLAGGERAIAYCVSVAHAKQTAEAFTVSGIRAECLSADTPASERERIMEDFRSGRLTVLCNCTLLSEGISIDEVSCVLLLRPAQSVALGVQQMMRCMRYLPGKTAKILDFVGNYTRIGLPDDDREYSLDKPIPKRSLTDENGNFYIRSCPECFMTFATAPVCPFCGAEYPLHPREIQAHEEIELRRITEEEAARVAEAKKRARIEQGQAKTFEELVQLGRKRGYANPAFWAAQVLRSRKR
jgi:superfamily II DNA or RNA helicase